MNSLFDFMHGLFKKFCNRETIAYLITGIVTTIVGLAVFWLCEQAGWHVALSNTVSVFSAIAFAFVPNKIFVFRSFSWAAKVLAKEIPAFFASRSLMFVLETALLVLLVDWFGLPGFVCKVFTTALVVVGNYVVSKYAVFRKG